jgi:thioredoxin-related protein
MLMLKSFLFVGIFWVSSFGLAQEIKWVSLEKAVELQKKQPKKIIMDMYTAWCGPCKMLDKNTFGNADVIDYINKNYYAVKFNAEGNETVNFQGNVFTNPSYDPGRAKSRNSQHQLSSFFRVTAYPTMVFLDEKAQFITPVVGYKNPQQLELYLKLFQSNEYKSMTTQEQFKSYSDNFKPEFTN